MKPSEALRLHREDVLRIVAKYPVLNPRVFGSVARGEDTEESDLDLLVDPTPETSLFDIGGLLFDLKALLKVPVDVLLSSSLPEKKRPSIFKEAVIL